jgi:hypothetical protein
MVLAVPGLHAGDAARRDGEVDAVGARLDVDRLPAGPGHNRPRLSLDGTARGDELPRYLPSEAAVKKAYPYPW